MHDRRTFLRAVGAGSIGVAGLGALGGTASAATILTIRGAGDDIWGTEDAFHYYYDEVDGDFDVTVEVTALEATDPFAKTGLMVRESLEPDAANVMLRRLPNGQAQLQWRPAPGADSVSTTSGAEDESEVDGGGIAADFVRLRREGAMIEAYGSNDGENWTLIADLDAENVDLPSSVSVGVPVTSNVAGTLCTAQLRDLEGISPTENVDVGDVGAAGSVSVEEGVPFVSTGAASDVTATGVTLHGEATDLGGAEAAECYFEYRQVPTESWETSDAVTLADPGAFSAGLEGLTSRRYYEYRAVLETSDGDRATGSTDTVGTPSRSRGKGAPNGPPSASYFDPDAGFADPAPWLDDDTPVIPITEPTRRQLEAAVGVDGPRLVVFETSGAIDLEQRRLTVRADELYLAGQTAPSPGITLTHGDLWLDANDCVVQHLRVRPGDSNLDEGEAADWEPDGIRTEDGSENNVIDHCTTAWSVDENLSVGYETANTTISNCLIAEPLVDATHAEGEHGYGSLIGDGAENVALVGNVWAFNVDRNPRLKVGTRSVVVNNLVHHYHDGVWMDPDTEASIEGNVYERPQTDQATVFGDGNASLADNVTDPAVELVGDGVTELDERPLWPDDLEPMPAEFVVEHTLANAGARPADRSAQDERIVEQIVTGTGGLIDSQEEVGGYPDLEVTTRDLRVPERGTRAWLRVWSRRVEAGGHGRRGGRKRRGGRHRGKGAKRGRGSRKHRGRERDRGDGRGRGRDGRGGRRKRDHDGRRRRNR